MFGPMDVRIDGEPIAPLRSRKGYWLLALLVLRQGAEVSRNWLAGTLWPDSSEERAHASLRQSLTNLRSTLGGHSARLRSPTPGTLCFDLEGLEADVAQFDACLARGGRSALETAVRLYRGPLLEGCTEEWIVRERELREQGYLATLESLAEEAMDSRGFGAAIRYLRLAVTADPYRESTHCALMRALVADGDSAAAMLVYRDLRLFLHREMNAEPTAETTRLYRQLRADTQRKAAAETDGRDGAADRTGSPHNLPRPLTPLIGREAALTEIADLLQTTRLLTITGPAGIGKTRVAVAAAEQVADDYPDGAWFVDIGPLGEPEAVPAAIARALGARPDPTRPILEELEAVLKRRSMLLVLNNCEQLSDACAGAAEYLLSACPRLRILVSSQQALELVGERTWRTPALTLPPEPAAGSESSAAAMLHFESVRLFAERAEAASSFAFTRRNAALVAQICRRLDGNPLAIELAAARLRALSLDQIAERLDDRFALLVGGGRTSLARHRTLKAALDWSWDLLTEQERRLVARLAAFAGGATLEAAEIVCGAPEDPAAAIPEVLDVLSRVIGKSLASAQEVAGEAEYRLTESARAYAREQLRLMGEEAETQRRHREYFLALAQAAAPRLSGSPEQARWLARLQRSHADLEAALEQFLRLPVTGDEDDHALRLAVALAPFWTIRGDVAAGRVRLERPLRRRSDSTLLRARAMGAAGLLATLKGDTYEALRLLESGLKIHRELGDVTAVPGALVRLGMAAEFAADLNRAASCFEQSLRLAREQGADAEAAAALDRFGAIAYMRGDYIAAYDHHHQAQELHVKCCDADGLAWSRAYLAAAVLALGNRSSARSLLRQSLAQFRELADVRGIAGCLVGLAAVTLAASDARADIKRAARLFGAAERIRQEYDLGVSASDRADVERNVGILRSALGEESYLSASAQGRGLSLDQATDYALEMRVDEPA